MVFLSYCTGFFFNGQFTLVWPQCCFRLGLACYSFSCCLLSPPSHSSHRPIFRPRPTLAVWPSAKHSTAQQSKAKGKPKVLSQKRTFCYISLYFCLPFYSPKVLVDSLLTVRRCVCGRACVLRIVSLYLVGKKSVFSCHICSFGLLLASHGAVPCVRLLAR